MRSLPLFAGFAMLLLAPALALAGEEAKLVDILGPEGEVVGHAKVLLLRDKEDDELDVEVELDRAPKGIECEVRMAVDGAMSRLGRIQVDDLGRGSLRGLVRLARLIEDKNLDINIEVEEKRSSSFVGRPFFGARRFFFPFFRRPDFFFDDFGDGFFEGDRDD